jgi:hypothetical protein
MTTLTDFEHKLDTLIKTYPDGVPRDVMNDLVRENAISWDEREVAQDQRAYLVSRILILDLMKEMTEHSHKMVDESEKNQPILGKVSALKSAPEPVKTPSMYDRVCRMF